MSECYDIKLCAEKHKQIDETFDLHERRLNDHADRLKKLEGRGERVDEKLEDLCGRLDNLISTLKWGMGILGASFLGLFIYLLELHLK
ncbi:hemolysin XhlA family protein [Clostridium ljungdahlii]|uniref:Hemolysin XhlA n=1 Tax=Clostridium ljungdahlii TaxID=1538 RepID=A0A162NB53_9CLOT|nr:hemolysin XhlA family protein [Clostridium ljungdahlii]OAA91279.1 hemolysin XhlA [Clostridium ljungdahlii]